MQGEDFVDQAGGRDERGFKGAKSLMKPGNMSKYYARVLLIFHDIIPTNSLIYITPSPDIATDILVVLHFQRK